LEGLIMARNAALPIPTVEPGLTHYLEEIRRFPMLERQEEYRLAKRWREHGDRDAAHKLVTSHLRLVTKIARDYRGYGLPISEAISEGNVGLMQAVECSEPEKGFRLATYAVWWIKAAIREDGEWQDWLVDESPDQETTLAANEEFDNRHKTLSDALTVLNERERRIFETRRLADARTKAQGGTTKVARPALVTGRSECTPAASSSRLSALWLQPTSRIASRIRTSWERADSPFGVASCVRKGGRATTEQPIPQIKPMSTKRALRRRWPDVLLRLPLENLRMYGERKE
jgi:RNA polymerase sigma factor (sigma-70 family)